MEFTEQEVFAKIGFLTMALERFQQENQRLLVALKEKDEPTGDEGGRSGEAGGENS